MKQQEMRILTRWAMVRREGGGCMASGWPVCDRNVNMCNCIYGHQRARANNQPQKPGRSLSTENRWPGCKGRAWRAQWWGKGLQFFAVDTVTHVQNAKICTRPCPCTRRNKVKIFQFETFFLVLALYRFLVLTISKYV